MCFRKSRRLSIFCKPRHRKHSTVSEKTTIHVKRAVSTALKEISLRRREKRQSISVRMKSIKPIIRKKSNNDKTKGNIMRLLKLLEEHKSKLKKKKKVEIKRKKILTNVRNTTNANKLELYRQTVTALQYMCWYTMHGVAYLAHLLQCDSSDPKRTKPDGDSRANNNDNPFGCALYSFCPNPCCGGLKEPNKENCWNRFSNPCRLHGLKGGRGCNIPREQNLNYNILVDHGIKVSCDCGEGRRYESVASMCVWRDHCLNPDAACPEPHQHCFNLFSSHGCRCDLDNRWSDYDQRCVLLYPAKRKEKQNEGDKEKEEEKEDESEEQVKDSPFFKWLNKLIETSIETAPKLTLNYNWSVI